MGLEKKLAKRYAPGCIVPLKSSLEVFDCEDAGGIEERWGCYLEKGALLFLDGPLSLGEELVITQQVNGHLEGRAVSENDVFYDEICKTYSEALHSLDLGQGLHADAVAYALEIQKNIDTHRPLLCYRSSQDIESFSSLQKEFQRKLQGAVQHDAALRLYSSVQWQKVCDAEKEYSFIFAGNEDHPLLRRWEMQFEKSFKDFFPLMHYARTLDSFAFLVYLEEKPLPLSVVGPVIRFVHHNADLYEQFPLPHLGFFEVLISSLGIFVQEQGHSALLMPAVDIPSGYADILRNLKYRFVERKVENRRFMYFVKHFSSST